MNEGSGKRMKTLVINGSPRKNGDTQALIDEFVKHLHGEVRVISWEDDISPCIDCRHCWTKPGCAIDDDMQEVYEYLEVCNNVAIASPIWFSSLSGPMLNIASRVQSYFAAGHFRGEKSRLKRKDGVILLAGAERGTEAAPIKNALTIMKLMNVRRPCAAVVTAMDTNEIPAKEDAAAMKGAADAARTLNRLYEGSCFCREER